MGLNLPTDIKWERIRVSHDMMDRSIDDIDDPPRWNSSIALFRYVPEEDYQVYEGRKITYLKVTCTICGYQEKKDEIARNVFWEKVYPSVLTDLARRLETYHPCTGAIIQVSVLPTSKLRDLNDYPYIMDFQPKKRELYETSVDSKEIGSRTLESAVFGKASGTTVSKEVLDMKAHKDEHLPTQNNVTNLNATNVVQEETTDSSREAREGESHVTQISQIYSLLDSYHVGTNRAIFFVQPRAHTLEEPSGFVIGPRPVEGIQEFLIVINQPKDQDGFCVAVRMDTSHLLWLWKDDMTVVNTVKDWNWLFITTRGLRYGKECIQSEGANPPPTEEPRPTSGEPDPRNFEENSSEELSRSKEESRVVGAWSIPKNPVFDSPQIHLMNSRSLSAEQEQREIERVKILRQQGMMTTKEANYLTKGIRDIMFRSLMSSKRLANGGAKSLLDLTILPEMLGIDLSRSNEGIQFLNSSISGIFSPEITRKLENWFNKDAQNISRKVVLETSDRDLLNALKDNTSKINVLKLALLGVPIDESKDHGQNKLHDRKKAERKHEHASEEEPKE